jgi:hypothetical protein
VREGGIATIFICPKKLRYYEMFLFLIFEIREKPWLLGKLD